MRSVATRFAIALAACLLAALLTVPAASAASSWFVSNSATGAGQTIDFGFGEPGDVFLAGDWNGDGTDTPGVFRPLASGPVWVLSNSTTGAGPLITFAWGNPGDLPVVGDWDQNLTDTAGLFRPDPSGGPNTFILSSSNVAGGGNTATFTLGNLGDSPIGGDWNGDLRDTVGIYRPVGTEAGLSDFTEWPANVTLVDPATVQTMAFGTSGDAPLTGDWNGDHTDTPGVFHALGAGGGWVTKLNNVRADPTSTQFTFGNGDDRPVVGDWDGNGTSTPAVVRPALAFVGAPVVPPAGPGGGPGGVAPGQPNGQNASRSAKLSARYATTTKRVRRLGFSSTTNVTGRLVDEHGAAISAASVVVQARRRQSRATSAPIDTVTTGADGAFAYRVPSGPSRTITFAYTAFSGDPAPAATDSLSTRVRASLTASMSPASPRARRIATLTGKLRYLPRAGVQVIVQARNNGAWSTVATVKTKAGGSYAWRHRFLSGNRGHRFLLRAHVDSPVYPFTPGNSRAVSVRVR